MRTIHKLQRNIQLNMPYNFLQAFDVTSGIWMIYLTVRGLSLFEVGLMEALFHGTSFLMEIPTGAIADLYGRKTSRFIGRIINVLSLILMLLATQTWVFACAFILHAISYNLESGAGDALIYDTMKEMHQEKGYMKIRGKQEMVEQIAGGLALPLGGLLATKSYGYVYIAAIAVALITLSVAALFIEPSYGRLEKTGRLFSTFMGQLKASVLVVKDDLRIAFFIMAFELFSVLVTTTFFYIQNFLNISGESTFTIGVFLSGVSILAGITASKAHRIEGIIGFKKTILYLPMIEAIGFILLGIEGASRIGFVIVILTDALFFVVMNDYINRLIPSHRRATVLSFQSMAFSMIMMVFFPLVGWVGDHLGLIVAFRVIGITAVILVIWMAFVISKNQKMTWTEFEREV